MGEQVIHISDTTTPDSAVLDLQSNLNREYFSSASSRKNSIHPADNSELPISLQFQQVSGTGNPQESWLPITASRDGNAFYSAFHSLNSGIGFQVLMLPVAFSILGWTWGIICLSAVFGWQFYTKWLLIQLHEPVSGVRYNRYLNLSKAAFGEKLGNLLAIFPVMFLSGGTCAILIITSGETIKLLMRITADPTTKVSPLTTVECNLVFICAAVALSLVLPNLNSVAWISFIGAITAVLYCTLFWVVSVSNSRKAIHLLSVEGRKFMFNDPMSKLPMIMNGNHVEVDMGLPEMGHEMVQMEVSPTNTQAEADNEAGKSQGGDQNNADKDIPIDAVAPVVDEVGSLSPNTARAQSPMPTKVNCSTLLFANIPSPGPLPTCSTRQNQLFTHARAASVGPSISVQADAYMIPPVTISGVLSGLPKSIPPLSVCHASLQHEQAADNLNLFLPMKKRKPSKDNPVKQHIISNFVAPSQSSCLAFPLNANFLNRPSTGSGPVTASMTNEELTSVMPVGTPNSELMEFQRKVQIQIAMGPFPSRLDVLPPIVHSRRINNNDPQPESGSMVHRRQSELLRSILGGKRKAQEQRPWEVDLDEMEYVTHALQNPGKLSIGGKPKADSKKEKAARKGKRTAAKGVVMCNVDSETFPNTPACVLTQTSTPMVFTSTSEPDLSRL